MDAVIAIFGWVLSAVGVPDDSRELVVGLAAAITICLAVALIFTALRVAFEWWSMKMKGFIDRHQRAVSERLNKPDVEYTKILNIVAEGDEALAYLRGLQKASDTPFLLWTRGVEALSWDRMSPALRTVLLVLGIGAFGWFLRFTSGAPSLIEFLIGFMFFCEVLFFALVLLPMIIASFGVLVVPLLMALAPYVIRAGSHGFGGETVFDNWFSRIRVNSDPAGFSRVECFRHADDGSYTSKQSIRSVKELQASLLHCQLYSHPDIIKKIVVWLQDQRRRDTKS